MSGKNNDRCSRCPDGAVVISGNAKSCLDCGAYQDDHHLPSPQNVNYNSANQVPDSAGIPGNEHFLQFVSIKNIPWFNLPTLSDFI